MTSFISLSHLEACKIQKFKVKMPSTAHIQRALAVKPNGISEASSDKNRGEINY
jgi:hypothetical protein